MKSRQQKPAPQPESPIVAEATPEEYAVWTHGQKITGFTHYPAAANIAKQTQGRVWATVTKNDVVEFLYLID